jgi:hypothetical protein
MPAFLKRSAKAVHPEGCQLFWFPACYPKCEIAQTQWSKILNSASPTMLSSKFACFARRGWFHKTRLYPFRVTGARPWREI